jgi:hypothetical protein
MAYKHPDRDGTAMKFVREPMRVPVLPFHKKDAIAALILLGSPIPATSFLIHCVPGKTLCERLSAHT